MSDEPDPVGLPAGPLKCGTKGCDRLSVMIVFWPGQATRMCGFCLVRAVGIAEAMGFELSATLDDGRQLGQGGADDRRPATLPAGGAWFPVLVSVAASAANVSDVSSRKPSPAAVGALPPPENRETGRPAPERPLLDPASFPIPWWPKDR